MTIRDVTHWRRRGRIAAEVAALFALLAAIDRVFAGGAAFAGMQPSPLWVPVVAMALAYGTGIGVVAASLATAYWLALAAPPAGGDYLDRLLHLSLPPLLWFVAAGAIGEVTLARGRRIAWLRRKAATGERNAVRLGDAIEELSRTNRTLQVRIAAEAGTTGHAIATAARLASADPAIRRAAIVDLVTQASGSDDFTCYLPAGDGVARAWLRGGGVAGGTGTPPEVLAGTLTGVIRKRHAVLHVGRRADRVPLEGAGVAAVPLLAAHDGEMIGTLVFHTLPFAALDAHGLAALVEIGRWLSMLLEEAPRGMQRAAGGASGVGLVA